MTCEAPVLSRSRHIWRDLPETPLMVEIPAGEFVMGENFADKFANDTERPAHCVNFSTNFALSSTPVTVGQYRQFDLAHAINEADELPVVHVNWHDAVGYCHWLSERTGRNYYLPREAGWEYACRAGSRTPFSFGDEISPSQANYLYDETGLRVGLGRRTPVGSFPANAFGLFDLHGNVCEWVADAWHPNYLGAPVDGQSWTEAAGGFRRMIRGGAWDYLPRLLRSAWRDWRPADFRADNIGFRVVADDLKRTLPDHEA
jgi:formylglycine-generating enzyme required for sulfatase activity